MLIRKSEKSDYQTLINIWEASVRATHDFLAEEDIVRLKPLILEHYFDAVDLVCALDAGGQILGFCGVHDGNIEMLFIDPKARGQGTGRLLTRHAITEQGARRVDVNEQNPQAIGFYEHLGFEVIGRSELDGQGKPYPLLHMQLPGEQ
jgi:putative acetyltransferase